jgi:TonB-dependent SusC/RagA subfamily outer membrane receptor
MTRGTVALARAAPLLLYWIVPRCGNAQTVERRYESHATGAATVIYPGETAMGAQNLADLIQWYVPAAIITRLYDGGVNISLRNECGANKYASKDSVPNPLLIIDGVKVSNANVSWNLLSLNPFLLERIEVLRDRASTAVYGTRAVCGVILVFTRRR